MPCGSCKNLCVLELLLLLTLFLPCWFFSPWRWRRFIPLQRLFLQEPHVTSHKSAFFGVKQPVSESRIKPGTCGIGPRNISYSQRLSVDLRCAVSADLLSPLKKETLPQSITAADRIQRAFCEHPMLGCFMCEHPLHKHCTVRICVNTVRHFRMCLRCEARLSMKSTVLVPSAWILSYPIPRSKYIIWEICYIMLVLNIKKQTPWPLVRKRTIPTERPPLVGEIYCQLLRIEGCRVVSAADPLRSLISVFWTGAATFLSSSALFYPHKGWVDPIPDPLLSRTFGSAGNWTQNLWVSSQGVWRLQYV
jgi:hypothetical protein